MNYSKKISGIPYCRSKTSGKKEGLAEWTRTVIEQTKTLPKVKEACVINVTFMLPEDKFPIDYPYGPDLDNLLKRFFDALNETIFSETKGKDSCVISLYANKIKVSNQQDAGAILEILPVNSDGLTI